MTRTDAVRTVLALTLVLAAVFAWTPRASAQTPTAEVRLEILGDVPHPVTLHAADLARMPRRSVSVTEKDGSRATYEGVSLTAVLQAARIPTGHGLRGEWMSRFLLVEAGDGYRVVFAIPEVDPAFLDRDILLADRKDGRALSSSEGPLRLVVPDERMRGRWVRQVRAIRVVKQP